MPAGTQVDLVEVKLDEEQDGDLIQIIIFVNPRSGGRQGELLLKTLEKEKHNGVHIFIIVCIGFVSYFVLAWGLRVCFSLFHWGV